MVNLTSKSGLEASKENSAYNATKAGEIHLMRGWALELGRADIRINCVAPGNNIRSSGTAQYGEQALEMTRRATPLKRLGTVDEVARLIIFLSSDQNDFVTGGIHRVDGGQSLWGDIWPIPEPLIDPSTD
jgi:citronellol/citronellal dehydrogenase